MPSSFSHAIFYQNPLMTLCFFAFAMSFLSLWIKKTIWLWGSFLLIAYILAFQTHTVSWISVIPVAILFVCHFILRSDSNSSHTIDPLSEIPYESHPSSHRIFHEKLGKGLHLLLFGTACLISFALIFHFMPGFHNWQIGSNLSISSNAHPYNLWLNFDKPFIGLFTLALSLPLIKSRSKLYQAMKIGLPVSIGGIIALIVISISFGQIKWDPKMPTIFFIWLLNNLVFVCIPEEAFFRGFIQRELTNWFGKNTYKEIGSILITSLVFALLHIKWVASFPFLILVFIASLVFGIVYSLTKSIEASILCHFGFNATHFLLFTYPALL